MITLKGDNRVLTNSALSTGLLSNYSSGRSAVNCLNVTGFNPLDFVLLGNIGSETAEIMQVALAGVDATLNALTFTARTKFAHPESTGVTVLPYNQIRFFWTANPVFDTLNPLNVSPDYVDVAVDSWYTTFNDFNHSTGYGWFVFYNSQTFKVTGGSTPIPYANFGRNTVSRLFDNFWSLLNNNELKMITLKDAYSWANEAFTYAKNELNMSNKEFDVPLPFAISVVPGTQEYLLPDNFGDVLDAWDGTSRIQVFPLPLRDVSKNDSCAYNPLKYYLRGLFIGFSPMPTRATTVTLNYLQIAQELTSYADLIALPDNMFYILTDWMMYRACLKLVRKDAMMFKQTWDQSIGKMKLYGYKRDAQLDSFTPGPGANI